MNALAMNWTPIKHFRPVEWPEGALENMEADLIVTIDEIRRELPKTHTLTPSPLKGAHVRLAGSMQSRHYALNRLSDATDLFANWTTIWKIWEVAQKHPRVGGIGLYTDTWSGDPKVTKPMIHIDLRPERLLWVKADEYVYLDQDPRFFFRLLAERGYARPR